MVLNFSLQRNGTEISQDYVTHVRRLNLIEHHIVGHVIDAC